MDFPLKSLIIAFILVSMAGSGWTAETGLITKTGRWPKKPGDSEVKINVCWEMEAKGDSANIYLYEGSGHLDNQRKELLGRYQVGYLKNEVKAAVERAWERYAGVDFIFKEDGPGCDAMIRVREIGQSKSDVGTLALPKKPEVFLNLLHLRYLSQEVEGKGPSQIERESRGWVALRAALSESGLRDFLKKSARFTGVHEFGHLLGFHHEHQRFEEAAAFREQSRGALPAGSEVVAYYDRYSVMNYNNSPEYLITPDGTTLKDRDGMILGEWPKLSCGDVIAARKMYPPGGTKAQLAPCCTETGFDELIADLKANSQPAYPTYADYYNRNRACFDSSEIRIGNRSVVACGALAKASEGMEVCKDTIEAIGIGWFGLYESGFKQNTYYMGENPEFYSEVSIKYMNNQPHFIVKMKVHNLESVFAEKVDVSSVPLRFKVSSRKELVGAPPSLKSEGYFYGMGNSPSNEVKWTFPMGHGPWDPVRKCYCSYIETPEDGMFVEYDPIKDRFVVDNSYTGLLFEARIEQGLLTMYYADREKTQMDPARNSIYSDLYIKNYLELNVGNEFRLQRQWLNSENQSPTRPVITGIVASDDGRGRLTVSWAPSSDADNDPVYYFVELKPENKTASKKYPAIHQTSLEISGLERDTKYLLRVVATDTKSRVFGDFQGARTPALPDACEQANTENVILADAPIELLKKSVSLSGYRASTSQYPSTKYWAYPESFCVEYLPNEFGFVEIPFPSGAAKTDWMIIEADRMMYADIFYREGMGPELHIKPGVDLPNPSDPTNSGNYIRLADYWGEEAPFFNHTQWATSRVPTKIILTFKDAPTSKATSRFGSIKLFKGNPFGVNLSGLRINGSVHSAASAQHKVYLDEPVEVELFMASGMFKYTGNFMTKFAPFGGSNKRFVLTQPKSIGINSSQLNVEALRFPYEVKTIGIGLDVVPNPVLRGLLDGFGTPVRLLVPGKFYKFDLSGIVKPISTLGAIVNGIPVKVDKYNGNLGFYWQNDNSTTWNEIQLEVDGVKTNKIRMATTWILSVLVRILD